MHIMPNTILIGAQWGDEGKGKMIDFLARKSDYIVRFQGGNNAGHTVWIGTNKYVLHHIPSGILNPGKRCLIGNGVVLDLDAFFEEIEMLTSRGISVKNRIFVSDRAHVIFPYHRLIDQLREDRTGAKKIGTTKRGIGPCYADKANRLGIRVSDLMNPRVFKERLKIALEEKNLLLKKIYQHKPYSFQALFKKYSGYRKKLAPYVRDTNVLLEEAQRKNRKILFEGAQGTLLDVDHGTYPFVTSSNASAGGAVVGAGVSPTKITAVIGVVKAYTTRVGEGPLPSVFPSRLMNRVQALGKEFGATTGRPRRCGWFDALVVRHAVLVNGLTKVVVMKLDVLDTLAELKICVAYRYRNQKFKRFPADLEVLEKATPIYESMPGWLTSTEHIRKFKDLPRNAKRYLRRIESLIQIPISLVSVGSERSQTISVNGKL
jgi:adenylosuccinate synthase